MREFQEKKKIKRRIYSKLSVLVLAIILALVAEGTWKVYQKDRESAANLTRVQSQLADLNHRNSSLADDIARLKTDQGVESEIRSKYQVSKDGEEVLVIVDKNSTTTSSTSTGNFLKRWWENLINLFKRKD